MMKWGCVFVLLAGLAAAPDAVVNDFEHDAPAAKNADVQLSKENPPQGESFLHVETKQPRAYVRLPFTEDISKFDHLSAAIRSHDPADLRWLALDEKGRPIFQRRFKLLPGEEWTQLDSPLRTWRWGDQFVGDWSEVKELVLRVDSPATTQVDLDDVRFAGDAQSDDREHWLLGIAFAKHPFKRAAADDLSVATDCDVFTQDDLQGLLRDMQHARTFIRRVFGDAVRATDHDGPINLLIFSDDGEYHDFFSHLAEQWQVEIAPPLSQGYTIQDISASTYRKEIGVRRPVYLHESVHAIAARDLRLPSSYAPDTAIQEGLANYVQVCVYPNSIDRKVYADNFAKPLDSAGQGFFKPLKQLFGMRVGSGQYAQLASFMAYLIEKDPDLLRALSRGLADGQSATQVLTDQKKSWDGVQQAWLDWGKGRFVVGSNEKSATIFDPPAEFK